MPQEIVDIFRALIDAAFRTAGISEVQHTELHAKLSAAAEHAPEPESELEPGPAAVDPEPAGQAFGSESHPYA